MAVGSRGTRAEGIPEDLRVSGNAQNALQAAIGLTRSQCRSAGGSGFCRNPPRVGGEIIEESGERLSSAKVDARLLGILAAYRHDTREFRNALRQANRETRIAARDLLSGKNTGNRKKRELAALDRAMFERAMR